ncbi:hypothetical protein NIES204_32170 [Planktothrix agardhii NIES-204]|nr:hypothetical protein NIES204_32170 [Planktothrix agardhii NIES-204]
MTKKNLKPQQAAPVQREINTTSSEAGTGLTPLDWNRMNDNLSWYQPRV